MPSPGGSKGEGACGSDGHGAGCSLTEEQWDRRLLGCGVRSQVPVKPVLHEVGVSLQSWRSLFLSRTAPQQ